MVLPAQAQSIFAQPSHCPLGAAVWRKSLAAELPQNVNKDIKRGAGASELGGEQQMDELGTER